MSVALPTTPNSTASHTTIVCTVSSDGFIRIFDLAALPLIASDSVPVVTTITSIAEYDTKGSRLTCCTLADGEARPCEKASGKRKRDDEEDNEGNNDSEIEGDDADASSDDADESP